MGEEGVACKLVTTTDAGAKALPHLDYKGVQPLWTPSAADEEIVWLNVYHHQATLLQGSHAGACLVPNASCQYRRPALLARSDVEEAIKAAVVKRGQAQS